MQPSGLAEKGQFGGGSGQCPRALARGQNPGQDVWMGAREDQLPGRPDGGEGVQTGSLPLIHDFSTP